MLNALVMKNTILFLIFSGFLRVQSSFPVNSIVLSIVLDGFTLAYKW